MRLPDYTELSNFTTRRDGKKLKTDLSIVLIINKNSDPVETINSIYSFITGVSYKSEIIIVNIDKEGYKYDRLLSNFPALRILLPQEKIPLKDAFFLAAQESLSKYILFIDESFKIRSIDMELLETYLQEQNFGIILPVITDAKDDTIPNIMKGSVSEGFLTTISVDMKGIALSSLYSKYLCFILNRDILQTREIVLNEYKQIGLNLLELGLSIWREGFMILQSNQFKVKLIGPAQPDIVYQSSDGEYLYFNLMNFTDKTEIRGRGRRIFAILVKAFFTFQFERIGFILQTIRDVGKRKIAHSPIDDGTIFATINKDFK